MLLVWVMLGCSGGPEERAEPTVEAAPEAPEGMVYVPEGEVHLPCEGEALCATRVGGFFMDRLEVTVGAYAACVEAGACPAVTRLSSTCQHVYTGRPDDLERPVGCVEHDFARSYCAWLGRRLPRPEEWVRAAFGDDPERLWPWGNEAPSCELAGVCAQSLRPYPVGSHPRDASPFGVLDMGGNVMELASDDRWYGVSWGWLKGEEHASRSLRTWSASGKILYGNAGFRCVAEPTPRM